MSRPLRPIGDDDPVIMTPDERSVWIYLVAVILTSGTYVAVVTQRLLTQPFDQVSWVTPLLWAVGASIAATIIGGIFGAIGSAVSLAARGIDPQHEMGTDQRDKEIARLGGVRNGVVASMGLAAVLVLTILDVDRLWIGNTAFLAATLAAVVEGVAKIRAYRRGF